MSDYDLNRYRHEPAADASEVESSLNRRGGSRRYDEGGVPLYDSDESWEYDGDPDFDPAAEAERDAWTEIVQIDRRLAVGTPRDAFSFDPKDLDPTTVERMRVEREMLAETYGEPPAGFEPPSIEYIREARPRSPSPFEAALATGLSERDLDHWRRLQAGETQTAIEAALGISQPAVSKRERALRAKVDEIYRRIHGRPYPWLPVSHGGRKRRR